MACMASRGGDAGVADADNNMAAAERSCCGGEGSDGAQGVLRVGPGSNVLEACHDKAASGR